MVAQFSTGILAHFSISIYIIATYFSDKHFYHKENIEKSAYMLINNAALKETPDLVSRIETFFVEQYEYFE